MFAEGTKARAFSPPDYVIIIITKGPNKTTWATHKLFCTLKDISSLIKGNDSVCSFELHFQGRAKH